MEMKSRFRGFLPVVLDLETGGFESAKHAVLEIAALTLDFEGERLGIVGRHRWAVVPHPATVSGAVPQAKLGFPAIPDVSYTGVFSTRYLLDFGPRFEDGILDRQPPAFSGRPTYPAFVSRTDEDGNEVAGIRLPPVAAPVATTTGWALRRAGFGENDGGEADGQHIPFVRTKQERLACGDPRLSLEERYGDHQGYVRAAEAAARELEAEGFLLPADVRAYVAEAEASQVLR